MSLILSFLALSIDVAGRNNRVKRGRGKGPRCVPRQTRCVTPHGASNQLNQHQRSELSAITNVYRLSCNMALLPRLRPTLKALAPSPCPARRTLHLAPPWLLDDYIPRYHLISSIDASKKRSKAYAHLSNCNLCPRLCGVNRYEKTGVCLIGAEKVKVNTVAPHFGEGE